VNPDPEPPDPHSFGCLTSGSGGMEVYESLQINLVFCLSKGFCTFVCAFFDLLPTLSTYIFHVKILLFSIYKSDQDPYPDWFGFLDLDPYPDPH
jgi:hypothetical protein